MAKIYIDCGLCKFNKVIVDDTDPELKYKLKLCDKCTEQMIFNLSRNKHDEK